MKTLLPPDRAGATGFDEVDRLLSDFYRAELPQPWPRLRAPAPAPPATRPRTLRSWFPERIARPLGLAAAVAFLLFGYFALAAMFPGDAGRRPTTFDSPHMGNRPGPRVEPVRLRTPQGNEAHGWEKDENGVFELYLERIPQPARKR